MLGPRTDLIRSFGARLTTHYIHVITRFCYNRHPPVSYDHTMHIHAAQVSDRLGHVRRAKQTLLTSKIFRGDKELEILHIAVSI